MIAGRHRIAGGVFVATLLALTAYWVYMSFELYEEEIEIGLKGEAREDPYLALARFLRRYGATVESLSIYAEIPPTGVILYFPAERSALSARQNAELRAFAEAGGDLIVVTHTLWEDKPRSPDPLLDPLGAAQFENKPPVPPPSALECPASGEEDEDPRKPRPCPVALPEAAGKLMLNFDRRFRLEERGDPALWRLGDTFGIHALRYRVGRGTITVLTDDALLQNTAIGRHDHAALAAWLLAPRPGGLIRIIRDHDAQSLFAWLWEHARPVVLAFLLLLGAWLWRALGRFGPILPDAVPERRSLVEHITASGRFLWQHGASGALVAAAADALRERIRIRHPAWAGLPIADLAARLAAFAGLSEPAIARALAADPHADAERFAEDIEILESLRKRL